MFVMIADLLSMIQYTEGGQTATPSNIPNPPITDNNIAYPDIGDNPNYDLFAKRGWICPKCGAVLSPSTTFCPFCAPRKGSTIMSDKTTYTVDYTQHDSITGTSFGQYVNPNISKTISKE